MFFSLDNGNSCCCGGIIFCHCLSIEPIYIIVEVVVAVVVVALVLVVVIANFVDLNVLMWANLSI